MDYFGNNPHKLLFGSGVSAGYLGGAPHNTYIDLLYYYGLVGTVLFLISLISAFSTSRKLKRTSVNAFPIVCILISFFFLSDLMYYDFVFSMILSAYVFNYDFNNTGKGVIEK